MTYDDSVQDRGDEPCAAARAIQHVARWETSGLETIKTVVVSGRRRMPVARKPVSASRPRGKFSALQSLEIAQNAEGISRLCELVPMGRRNGLAPTGKARRAAGAGGQRQRRPGAKCDMIATVRWRARFSGR